MCLSALSSITAQTPKSAVECAVPALVRHALEADGPQERWQSSSTLLPGAYFVTARSDRTLVAHAHEEYAFSMVDEGMHMHHHASLKRTYVAHAGELLLTAPGETHAGLPVDGQVRAWRTLYVFPDLVQRLLATPQPLLSPALPRMGSPDAARLFDLAFRQLAVGSVRGAGQRTRANYGVSMLDLLGEPLAERSLQHWRGEFGLPAS